MSNFEDMLRSMQRELGKDDPLADVDASQFREQAQALWASLDRLSATDRKGYEEFIQSQMMQAADDAAQQRGQLVPKPGFVIKCRASLPSAATAGKCFINVVHHARMPVPTTAAGEPVAPQNEAVRMDAGVRWDRQQLLNLAIPMQVSKIRSSKAKSGEPAITVDALIHTWPMVVAGNVPEFKAGLVDLVVDSVAETCSIRITPGSAKSLKLAYQGGLHGTAAPVPFQSADAAGQAATTTLAPAPASTAVPAAPSELSIDALTASLRQQRAGPAGAQVQRGAAIAPPSRSAGVAEHKDVEIKHDIIPSTAPPPMAPLPTSDSASALEWTVQPSTASSTQPDALLLRIRVGREGAVPEVEANSTLVHVLAQGSTVTLTLPTLLQAANAGVRLSSSACTIDADNVKAVIKRKHAVFQVTLPLKWVL